MGKVVDFIGRTHYAFHRIIGIRIIIMGSFRLRQVSFSGDRGQQGRKQAASGHNSGRGCDMHIHGPRRRILRDERRCRRNGRLCGDRLRDSRLFRRFNDFRPDGFRLDNFRLGHFRFFRLRGNSFRCSSFRHRGLSDERPNRQRFFRLNGCGIGGHGNGRDRLRNNPDTVFGHGRLAEEQDRGQAGGDGGRHHPDQRRPPRGGSRCGAAAAGLELGKDAFRKRTVGLFQFLFDYVFPISHRSCSFRYCLIFSFSCLRALARVLVEPVSLIPSISPISRCE